MNYDFIIVGSGAAGASSAKHLTDLGFKVLVLEEGSWYRRPDFKADVFTAIDRTFRGYGTQLAKGRSLLPILQGCCVGGSTVINGAISHVLPEEVYNEWTQGSSLTGAISLEKIRKFEAKIMSELAMKPTLPEVENLPVATALKSLQWDYGPMVRNAPGCKGSGNCLQGCQTGAKLSMEASYLPEAIKKGATLLARHKVLKVTTGKVWAKNLETGEKKVFIAKKGILLAAGVVHTPFILRKSGFHHPYIGKNFQCHLSFGVLARLPKKAREIEGQPQGIEVFPPDTEGIKLATQLLPPELLFARVPLVGEKLTQSLKDWTFFSSWTGSIRSQAKGEIGGFLSPKIKFTPTLEDMKKVRTAFLKIVELFFEMGAKQVYPGVFGLPECLEEKDPALNPPLDPRAYFLGAGHLFGSCRIGSNSQLCPVNEHFELVEKKGVYVVDASLFPTNIGVNPQLPIMALAMLGAEHIAERSH